MANVAEKTAYYFHRGIPAVALISKGVRLPAGAWMRIAYGNAVTSAHVEEMLASMFPELKGKVLTCVFLTNESEVKELERSMTPMGQSP